MSDTGTKPGFVTFHYQRPDGSWAIDVSPSQPDAANPYIKKILARERREAARRAKPRRKTKARKHS